MQGREGDKMAGGEKGMGSFHCAPVSVITAPTAKCSSSFQLFPHCRNQPHTQRGTTAGRGTSSVEALSPAS